MCVRAADRRSRSRLTLAPRPRRAADEFRKLCQELTTLPPRTLDRLALPAELRESIDEARGSGTRFLLCRCGGSLTRPPDPARPQHVRIGGKRGTGSTKKGRARVESLMAQCVPLP